MVRAGTIIILLTAFLSVASAQKIPNPGPAFKIFVFTAPELTADARKDKASKDMIDSANDVRKALGEHKDWFLLVSDRSDAEIILEIQKRYFSPENGNVVEGHINAFDGLDHQILGQGGLHGQAFGVWSTAAKDMAIRLTNYFILNREQLYQLRESSPGPMALKAAMEGNEHFNKKEYDAAIDAYSRALLASPKYANAWYNRGLSYYRKGEPDKALADFNEALKLNSKNVDALTNRGTLWLDKKDYRNALDDFTAALILDSKNAGALFGRAFVLARQGNCKEAILGYTDALKEDPGMVPAKFNRGVCYLKLGDDSALNFYHAIDDFTAAWNANRLDGEALMLRGEAQMGLNNPESAIADFDQALALFAPQQRTFFQRGNARLQLKRYDQAIEDYTRALEIDPQDARSYYNRSLAYQSKGLKTKAAEDRKKAIALDPELAQNKN